ncbi:bifunctional glutamate--cysteine ligase GshA/glutathione synthetase GshB [Aerococcus sanguinicola]
MRHFQAFLNAHPELKTAFQHVSLGIEREGHRIKTNGDLARSPHPSAVDGSSDNKYIQRDFAESQLELVTPPVYSEEGVYHWLEAIHQVALRSLAEDELLWPSSMPPVLPEDDAIHVADLDKVEDVAYREYLVKAYGKKVQMISGIHFNFGFDQDLLEIFYQADDQGYASIKEFTTAFYLRLARNFLRYEWLIVYLFGATPSAHDSFYNRAEDIFPHPIRSIRNSHLGYVNKKDVTYTYDNLPDYVEELEANVKDGRLIAEKEFYSNVRLRGAKQARGLLETGIKYLEFRLFDIQAEEAYGIGLDDIRFMKYFILYLVWADMDCQMPDVYQGYEMKLEVAEEETLQPTAYQEEGLNLLEGMTEMVESLGVSDTLNPLIDSMRQRLLDPSLTPSGRLVTNNPTVDTWLANNLDHAKANKEAALAHPYLLGGFEDMELSTQILLADAIQQGLWIDILDRQDQLIALTYRDHTEYVKNANITGKDSLLSYYLMGNKVVTKDLLQAAGFTVPKSQTFNSLDAAQAAAGLFVDKKVVVKPKSTNMGVGISIFKEGASQEGLREAFDIAFGYDDTVLVEEFAEGTEYRFFVLDSKCLAVLLRVPAFVKGDGQHSIRELVDLKNQDPKRGENHRTPLEKISLDRSAALVLEAYGYDFDSVPEADEIVPLRENSNISTGGDSIDVTDDMDPSYLELASQMAQALDVKVTGLDLMIRDRHQAAQADNYALIEANYNPMMMMHIYPAQGKGRRISKDLLAYLFPEKIFKD